MVRAKGRKDDRAVTVYYDKGLFLFNNEENPVYMQDMAHELNQRHFIGGTYQAESDYDILNILEVLRNHFFDKPVLDITVKDEVVEELPYEEGVVY